MKRKKTKWKQETIINNEIAIQYMRYIQKTWVGFFKTNTCLKKALDVIYGEENGNNF